MKPIDRPLYGAVLFALLCFASVGQAKSPEPPKPKNITSAAIRDGWEPIFFNPINSFTKRAALKPLRSYIVPRGDIEVRIWAGFGLTPLEVTLLSRHDGHWFGSFLKATTYRPPLDVRCMPLSAPHNGWQPLWHQWNKEGFFTLPDQDSLPFDHLVTKDGITFVVEINQNHTYRTYSYSNPWVHQRPEDRHMTAITKLLAEQFDLAKLRSKLRANVNSRSPANNQR